MKKVLWLTQLSSLPSVPELKKAIGDFFCLLYIGNRYWCVRSRPYFFGSQKRRRWFGYLLSDAAVLGQLYIKYLSVDKPYRQHGYGRLLMERAFGFGRKQGFKFVFLESMNFHAPKFYRKLCFQVDFARHDYAKGGSY